MRTSSAALSDDLHARSMKYPLDVESANGHYMIFNIYTRQASEKVNPAVDGNVASVNAPRFTRERFFDDADSLPTRLISDQIALYMPDDLSVNYKVNYEAAEVGGLVGSAAAASSFFKGETTGADFAKGLGMDFARKLQPLLSFGTLGGLEGATASLQRKTGLAAAPLQEMIFQNMDYRTFNYNFKMNPRNRKEAREVRDIIDTFTYHMLPEKLGRGSAIAFRVPSEFTIRYMYRGTNNDYLNHITFCALTDMKVDYGGGERLAFYRNDESGAPPVSTNVSLTFQELEFVDRRRATYGTHTSSYKIADSRGDIGVDDITATEGSS